MILLKMQSSVRNKLSDGLCVRRDLRSTFFLNIRLRLLIIRALGSLAVIVRIFSRNIYDKRRTQLFCIRLTNILTY